jgi:hypothetical protein
MSNSANDGGLAPPTDEPGLAKYADKGPHNESDDGMIGPDQRGAATGQSHAAGHGHGASPSSSGFTPHLPTDSRAHDPSQHGEGGMSPAAGPADGPGQAPMSTQAQPLSDASQAPAEGGMSVGDGAAEAPGHTPISTSGPTGAQQAAADAAHQQYVRDHEPIESEDPLGTVIKGAVEGVPGVVGTLIEAGADLIDKLLESSGQEEDNAPPSQTPGEGGDADASPSDGWDSPDATVHDGVSAAMYSDGDSLDEPGASFDPSQGSSFDQGFDPSQGSSFDQGFDPSPGSSFDPGPGGGDIGSGDIGSGGGETP